MIRIVHVEDSIPRKGRRFLIERSWPRGADRETLALDGWFKEAAPTYDLLRWYRGKLERYMEFREDYLDQLRERDSVLRKLREAVAGGDVILLHAQKDREYNHAAVLKEYLLKEYLEAP